MHDLHVEFDIIVPPIWLIGLQIVEILLAKLGYCGWFAVWKSAFQEDSVVNDVCK